MQMWANYAKVGIRALAKNRVYAFINIVGLAIGLAACLMLLVYVQYERSYDEWLPNSENVYQVQGHFRTPGTSEETDLQMSPYPAGPALRQDFSQIAAQVYLLSANPVVIRGGEALDIDNGVMADNRFFDVLPLPLTRGDPDTALAQPNNVVLSETEARRLFGDEDAMGKTLTAVVRGRHVDLTVTGILRDLPRNSSMKFDFIQRIDLPTYFADNPSFLTQWGNNSGWNYVALRPDADPDAVRAALPEWKRRHVLPEQFGDQTVNQADFSDWSLVNIRDVHLGLAQAASMRAGNDAQALVTFTVIAFLILGMACINFTNLATARAGQRAREVALRKVLGANRRQLITQFLTESVILAAIAALLAVALVELLLRPLGNFLDADLEMHYFGAGGMLLPIIGLTLLVGAAGGLYPALYLSRFQPAQVLKANKSSSDTAGSGLLRSVLVIGQFAVSIALIICTIVVYSQTVYARTADPGYRREGLLQVEGISRRQIAERSEAIAREIAQVDGVRSVARTSIGVATDNQYGIAVRVPGQNDPVVLGNYAIDQQFFPTMEIGLVAGRTLTRDRPLDVNPLPDTPTPEQERTLNGRGLNVVVTELAARRLGFADPAQAVGAQLRATFTQSEQGLTPITIVGVVRDSRFRSIREPLEPMIYYLADAGLTHLMVRYDSPDPAGVRAAIEQVWRRVATDVPFDAQFSDDRVAELYDLEKARANMFAGFAVLAVVVACLGLFGLAAYTAERRTKEIGIRKVLGARTGDIVKLLAWQFSKPVIIANLIAWPVAWAVMNDWLHKFDARVDVGVSPFLLSGGLALIIALVTVSSHAIRVARANPIHALRYE